MAERAVAERTAVARPSPAIVLASGSPRRRELLERLAIEFAVVAPDIDESVREGEQPVPYVRRLSEEKALAACALDPAPVDPSDRGRLVIAADTTVDLDGHILGKPADADEVRSMLRGLSSRTHHVHTGVTLTLGARIVSEVTTTLVTFTDITSRAIEWYIRTGEPFDKAGAYGLQGAGGVFVSAVSGSVSNVVGLPLTTVVSLARSLGVELLG